MKLKQLAAAIALLFAGPALGVDGGVLRVGASGGGQIPPEIPFQSMTTLAYNIAASVTLTEKDHAGKTGLLNLAGGLTVTLPRATGSGAEYSFFVKTACTTPSYIIAVGNADDVIQGIITSTLVGTPTTNNGWIAGSTGDTITLNGTTTGGLRGDWIVIKDVASGLFTVKGSTSQSSTGATPFSAAVS